MTVNVITAEMGDYFRWYRGQFEPQPAYIELDVERETLRATYDADNTRPIGNYRFYPITPASSAEVNQVLGAAAPLAERICEGDETAEEELEAFIEVELQYAEPLVKLDADYCIGGDFPDSITAKTSDEELEAIADRLVEEAMDALGADECLIDADVLETLIEYRDELQDEAETA